MNLIEPDDQTSGFLAETIKNLTEGLSGIAASDKKDWALSVGYLLQRIRSGHFLETLKKEWDDYRVRGKIKDDYLATPQHQECLQSMLDFLDRDSPDETRFNAMRNIFLTIASEERSSRFDVLPQQFMRICRSLNSTEILILQANYALAKSGHNPEFYGRGRWTQDVANHSAFKLRSLVQSQEASLAKKCLISESIHHDNSGVERTPHFRMTELGYQLCQFMVESGVQANTESSE
ncbi:hypothetical protein N9Y42_09950 [Mariniblastus sp.]|nr:hypothetical protein [Mariniblastus sp.]